MPGAKQHFGHIDIAQPRDDPLIEQRRLDRGCAALQPLGQIIFVEIVAERLGAKPRQEPMRRLAVGAHQIHRAETPRIVEGHPRAALHLQHHMVMFLRRRMIQMEPAEHHPGHQHPPRHAQMDQQALAAVEIGQDIFRAPPQLDHPARPSAARPSPRAAASADRDGSAAPGRSRAPPSRGQGRGGRFQPRAVRASSGLSSGGRAASQSWFVSREGYVYAEADEKRGGE